MLLMQKGRYRVRIAQCPRDIRRAQSLRYKTFLEPIGSVGAKGAIDGDRFDASCLHVLIEDIKKEKLVGCFRLLPLSDGSEIEKTYSAQYYDLSALHKFKAPMAELGRFSIDSDSADPDVLRIAWGAMTHLVDQTGVKMLFGCSSFKGVEAQNYQDAFAYLKARHLAPDCWQPGAKAENIYRFTQDKYHRADEQRSLSQLPSLLRTYLDMGGWVSDHAVVDVELNTLHVFTGLEIVNIPPTRARWLRAMAA